MRTIVRLERPAPFHVPVRRLLSFAVALACVLVAGCPSGASNEEASIAFSTVPPAADGGPDKLAPVAGRVSGGRANQRVVLFTRSGRLWWVQPLRSHPFTTIESDATWKSTIHMGMEYAALLVEHDYRPPVTVESLPPRGGGVIAAVTAKGTGSFVPPPTKKLSFSGYEWVVRQNPGARHNHGTTEYDGRNAWVDGDGHLHLMLSRRDGRWTSADVWVARPLGYGTYMITVRDTSQLDPAAIFELWTWDEAVGSARTQHEVSIDISGFHDPPGSNAQYVVQPDFVAANVFPFHAPAGRLTHSLRWEQGMALFTTLRGTDATRPDARLVQRRFTVGVPVPGTGAAHLALFYARDSPNPPTKDIEVVVEKFVYFP